MLTLNAACTSTLPFYRLAGFAFGSGKLHFLACPTTSISDVRALVTFSRIYLWVVTKLMALRSKKPTLLHIRCMVIAITMSKTRVQFMHGAVCVNNMFTLTV